MLATHSLEKLLHPLNGLSYLLHELIYYGGVAALQDVDHTLEVTAERQLPFIYSKIENVSAMFFQFKFIYISSNVNFLFGMFVFAFNAYQKCLQRLIFRIFIYVDLVQKLISSVKISKQIYSHL